jgi:K+-transporting ATPase KdpF subunit
MSAESVVGILAAAAILVYLLYTLVRPERF